MNPDAVNKVKVGFFSFTEITDPGEHRAYNEWHQLDHMPEQFPLRGIAYGQRWVSTPACRAARAASGARLDPIHYMTLYLVTEPVDETLREFRQLGRDLYDAGRFHLHRHSHLSGPFALVDSAVAPRVLISAEAVPYRPHCGVYAIVQAASATAPDLDVVCATDGVAGAWAFADEAQRITIAWLDGEPLRVAAALASVAEPGDGVELAGPFETITPWQWGWFEG
jgi:hypothetical protein